MVPSTLTQSGAVRFWLAVVLTGAGAGLAAAGLTRLLEAVERLAWRGTGCMRRPMVNANFAAS